MRIDTMFDDIISFNTNRVIAMSEQKTLLGELVFARELQTVKIDLGRQCGKTMYIARTFGQNDVVFTRDTKLMEERIGFWSPHFKAQVHNVRAKLVEDIGDKVVGKVWIDDASHVSKDKIDEIYKVYAGKAEQFILIG
jgi:hypothetical protein